MNISVVTVCLNSAATIAATIESFLAQRHPEKQLLLIDGVSRDRSVEIVRAYNSPLIEVISEPDRGIYDAMNKGLRLFRGDAIGFLNSDDAFHDEFALVRIAAALQDGDIAYGDQYLVADHRSKRIVRTWRAGEYYRRAFQFGWVPPHPTFYVRRNVAEIVGEFETRYSIAADYDFMLRAMVSRPFRIRYIPKFLVDYQVGGSSTNSLSSILKGNLQCLDSRQTHLGSGPVDIALFMRVARRLLQLNWRGLLVNARDRAN